MARSPSRPRVRGRDVAEPVGRLRRRGRRRRACSRAPRSRPAAATPRSWRSRGRRRRGPGRHRRTPRSSRASHHGRTAAVRRRAHRRRRRPGRRRHRGPRPAGGRARASPGCGPPASTSTSASAPTTVAEPARAVPHHRRTGRPYVVLKLAATLDGRTAAPDGTSQWITGAEARADAHRLRAESDAVVVGAGTVRADDPSLTVRDVAGTRRRPAAGRARPRARRAPRSTRASSIDGDLGERARRARAPRASLQVLVEGGATVAGAFHRGRPRRPLRALPRARRSSAATTRRRLFAGPGAPTIDDVWRGAHRRRHPPRRRRAHRPRPPSEDAPDVHRHRRGAGHGACRRDGPRLRIARHDRARRRRARRRRSRSTAAASPSSAGTRRRAGGRPTWSTRRSPAPTSARSTPGDRGEPRAAGAARATGSAATSCRATSTRVGEIVDAPRPTCGCACRPEPAPLRRREGLDHRRRHQPHGRRRRSTTASPSP